MKIALNKTFGAFTLSDEAKERYMREKGLNDYTFLFECNYSNRSDPVLISIIEEMGEKSWGKFSELTIVEIPDDYYYNIIDYDGMERICYSTAPIMLAYERTI